MKFNNLIVLFLLLAPTIQTKPDRDHLSLVLLPQGSRDAQAETIFRDSLSGSASDALYSKQMTTHVLRFKDATVGFITHKILTDESLSRLHVDHLAVVQEHRRKGFGRFMLSEVEKQARLKNVHIVEIVYDDDVIEWYEKLGYIPDPKHCCTVMKNVTP